MTVADERARRVCLVMVGDELLSGRVTDTNSVWLGRFLGDAGLSVQGTFHAGDDVTAIVAAVRRALEDAPYVIVSGGLGRTSDDLTREALARLPGAAKPLPNPVGTEPGIRLDVAGGVVFAVPGVPREMQAIVAGDVMAELRDRAGPLPTIVAGSVGVVGVRESAVAERLRDLEAKIDRDPGTRVSYLVSPGLVEVRVRVVRDDAATAGRDLAAYAAQARRALGDDAFQGPNLAATVTDLLLEAGATCATAESLTGGALAGALTALPGSSRIFRGGVVAYATELKGDLLGVPADHLARHGPVHEQTAALMAEGVRARCRATYGLSTTGVAGPDPQDGLPPGTVHVAAAGPDGTSVRSLRLHGDRATIQAQTVVHALDLARRVIAPESLSTSVR